MGAALADLLQELEGREVRLRVEGGRLKIDAPKGAVDAALRARLSDSKADLVNLLVGGGPPTETSAPTVDRTGELPLSPAQERLLSVLALRGPGAGYLIPFAYELPREPAADRLLAALELIASRQESLRTDFPGGRVRIHPRVDVPLERRHADDEAAARPYLEKELARDFDIAQAPLWRAILVTTGDRCLLGFVFHHLVFDGASRNGFVQELEEAYRALSDGDAPRLPELSVQVVDHAARVRARDDWGRLRSWWSETLEGLTAGLWLPVDRHRGRERVRRGANLHRRLEADLVDGLERRARSEGATLFAVLAAAWQATLARHTGQLDLPLCLPTSGRELQDLEPLIGYLNNVVVLRGDLAGDPSLRELVTRARDAAREAWTHGDLPFQELAGLSGGARIPLPRGLFSYRVAQRSGLRLGDLSGPALELEVQAPDFELALYVRGEPDGHVAVLRRDVALFDAATAERLMDRWTLLLAELVRRPDLRLAELPDWRPDTEGATRVLAARPGVREGFVVMGNSGPEAWVAVDVENPPERADLERAVSEALEPRDAPRAYHVLAELPRDESGAFDPEAWRGRAPAAPLLPPRTLLEQDLVRIWREALWLAEDPGVRDDFFDLGGHSLVALELVQVVEAYLGRPLPLEALTRLSTIEHLAASIEKGDDDVPDLVARRLGRSGLSEEGFRATLERVRSWTGERATPYSLIVGRNLDGDRPPLLWITMGDNLFDPLAGAFGEDQPVYGARAVSNVLPKTSASYRAIGEYYADEFDELRPEGPLVIGGYCEATSVVHPLAVELRRRGRDVRLLCLHEKIVPRPWDGPVALALGRKSDRWLWNYYEEPEATFRQFYSGAFEFLPTDGEHLEQFQEPSLGQLVAGYRRAIDLHAMGPAPSAPAAPGPRALPWRGRIEATSRLVLAAPASELRLTVAVTNLGDQPWPLVSAEAVRLAAICNRKRSHFTLWADIAQPLDGPGRSELAPGETLRVPIRLSLPVKEGSYRFVLDLVAGGETWFADLEGETASVLVRLRRYYRPLSWLRGLRRASRASATTPTKHRHP